MRFVVAQEAVSKCVSEPSRPWGSVHSLVSDVVDNYSPCGRLRCIRRPFRLLVVEMGLGAELANLDALGAMQSAGSRTRAGSTVASGQRRAMLARDLMETCRRSILAGMIGAPVLALSGDLRIDHVVSVEAARQNPTGRSRTEISIDERSFAIDRKPTYEGRAYRDCSLEGLLFVSRMANGIVDDHNPLTRGVWNYPDGPWDPERNTSELIAQLPAYRACGLTSISVNIQGGNPQGYSWNQPWMLGGFLPDGRLRPDYGRRLSRLIDAADTAGMVVNLGLFYWNAARSLQNEAAVVRAVDETTDFLCEKGCRNVLVELGNEVDLPSWTHEIIGPARCHELIARIQNRSAGRLDSRAKRLLVSASFAISLPPDTFTSVADYLLFHGNVLGSPAMLRKTLRALRALPGYRGQPVLINEDDHYDFDRDDNAMMAAIEECAGWGYFDYRNNRDQYVDGFQSLPVDWRISSARKHAFFTYLAKVTGSTPPDAIHPQYYREEPLIRQLFRQVEQLSATQ